MKEKYEQLINHIGKITLLLVFTFMSVGSNPDSRSIMLVNENENLSKMVDIEQISSNRVIKKPRTDELIKLADELNANTKLALSKLSKDMDVGEPSGLTLDQFKKIITNSSNIKNDRHNVIKSHVEEFYLAEQKYGINGVFLMSIAVHESGWGTSKVALTTNNLFGYNVGRKFETYGSCIDHVARALMSNYLNEKGTVIKGMTTLATGKYHRGTTVASVNKLYAGDQEWNQKVYNYMVHFYGNVEK